MPNDLPEYPGMGLPIRHWPWNHYLSRDLPPSYPIGSHKDVPGSRSQMLPVREVAMMALMDRLTDKPEWHRKVFDEAIVGKWREEALAVPDREWMNIAAAPGSEWDPSRANARQVDGWGIMDAGAFDYCIEELQNKARYYEKTGLVPTLDASAAVVKSDVAVKDGLRDALRQAFDRLKRDQADRPDWHPNSGDMVQDLVHPSMYPLVYGRTKVLRVEVVGVSGAIYKWAGKGEVLARQKPRSVGRSMAMGTVPDSFWSDTYQWLPSNVAFQDGGRVKLASYINNLHPTKYPEVYAAVEQMIEAAIPAWDQCLLAYRGHQLRGPGRKGSRFTIEHDPDDHVPENWSPSDPAEVELDLSTAGDLYYWVRDETERKWRIARKPVLPSASRPAVVHYDPYTTPAGEDKTKGGLLRKFEASGLQVIVKMASIELTPDKPEFPVGGWHVEGMLNEKICATALYYLDSENITESRLAFRMQTSDDQDDLQEMVGQDSFYWLECNFGVDLRSGDCIQNYGSVETREGRLLAFPNVFQHRVSPFKLADPAKPGHRRFIALWLVDPFRRVISTANVPPQQQDWWTESAFGGSAEAQREATSEIPSELLQLLQEKGVKLDCGGGGGGGGGGGKAARLPPEMLDQVREDFTLGLMSQEEACEHRLKLMDERTSNAGEAQRGWTETSYSFCEH